MRQLYSLVFYCLMPLILLRMLWRSRLAPAYRQRLLERLGFFAAPSDSRPVIWVHAVSVGETIAAAPLVEQILQRYPEYCVVLSTTTPTGSERVRALFGERVFHVYAPWDLPGAVRRFMARIKPQLLLIMETELWPNMLHAASRRQCRVLLANARLSERSAKGYAKVGRLTRDMLGKLDSVACQAQEDGERLVALGLPRDKLHITGSIKFDLSLDEALRAESAELRQQLGSARRPVLVAASTHPGEDEQLLAAFSQVKERYSDCLLVLVPRHPERFDSVYGLCEQAGWVLARRSSGRAPAAEVDILLGDTMGELLLLLSSATVAVIGGSLVEHGGHNVLEASVWGVPVVTGPYMFNFEEISALLVAAGGMRRLSDSEELAPCLIHLLGDAEQRAAMAAAGLRVLEANRGAKQRLLELLDEQLQPPMGAVS
ncbi:lipid IV(A) 3-deoxy-D-manno-octulosonic acid transferase [Parahaliea sp. F7430]|uniref:3-deoxy-D-manno-octulosonic acid transferase n=1 Tax=Sediminihaliea albiluteola TaxID=2758564 RepID=A0A7W2TXN9_9GAMM|nr:lipid IV(A) 3-deoxy-D-manno-octulosonic acid transferase [Sediminihaliea albiluteola]MBA6413858.1 lipid IV(A) 3-deoxy-D-manno-octulosonic acid transferase [Sediminihaliea albiluteola]